MTIHEPAVTLTDFALAAQCALFAALLAGRTSSEPYCRNAFIAFFSATGSAAFLGAIAHGFVPDSSTQLYRLLWIGIFLSIGIASVAIWAAGSRLVLGPHASRLVTTAAIAAFAGYAAYVIAERRTFVVAIAFYVPAALFLLAALAIAYARKRQLHLVSGIAGVLLIFLGAAIQQMRLGIHHIYFDHNAVYHVVQVLALLLIFLSARAVRAMSFSG